MLLGFPKVSIAGKSRRHQLFLLRFSTKQSFLKGKLILAAYRIYDDDEEKFTAKP